MVKRAATMRHGGGHKAVFWLMALWAVFFAAALAHAGELRLENLVVSNHEGRVRVRFGLDLIDPDSLAGYFSQGGRARLDCRAVLSARRDYVWNRELAQAVFSSQLFREPDNGGYRLTLPDRAEPLSGADPGALVKQGYGEILLDLGPWQALDRGQDYVLGLSVRLVRDDLSVVTRNLLFFWPFNLTPPLRYQLDFSY